MWVKEIISDPAICSAHCCKCGFDRAGGSLVLYVTEFPMVIPPPQCAECGELAIPRSELPSCEHFPKSTLPPFAMDAMRITTRFSHVILLRMWLLPQQMYSFRLWGVRLQRF